VRPAELTATSLRVLAHTSTPCVYSAPAGGVSCVVALCLAYRGCSSVPEEILGYSLLLLCYNRSESRASERRSIAIAYNSVALFRLVCVGFLLFLTVNRPRWDFTSYVSERGVCVCLYGRSVCADTSTERFFFFFFFYCLAFAATLYTRTHVKLGICAGVVA
jgi:hypothetical protein